MRHIRVTWLYQAGVVLAIIAHTSPHPPAGVLSRQRFGFKFKWCTWGYYLPGRKSGGVRL